MPSDGLGMQLPGRERDLSLYSYFCFGFPEQLYCAKLASNMGKRPTHQILFVNILLRISASEFTREISLSFSANLSFRFWYQDNAGFVK